MVPGVWGSDSCLLLLQLLNQTQSFVRLKMLIMDQPMRASGQHWRTHA